MGSNNAPRQGQQQGGGDRDAEGRAPWRRRACFECGEFDHFARNCPKKGVALQAAIEAAFDRKLGAPNAKLGGN